MTNRPIRRVEASFRDPSGFLFTRDGVLYRQINRAYQDEYERLIDSGLYERLARAKLLVPHEEVDEPSAAADAAFKVIRPEQLAFISYPYEWSFSQLKDAALLTLSIQKKALAAGMTLKDSSAYNIQYHHGRPILIDTLSFEPYREGEPWVAYRQFCQHFLAPLALMSYRDHRLSGLLREFIDGVPLDLAAALLPGRTRLNLNLLLHLHLHAAAIKRYAARETPSSVAGRQMDKRALVGLIDGLESAVRKLQWDPGRTAWAGYYSEATGHYAEEAMTHKVALVESFLDEIGPQNVWDLGANTGEFSRLASDRGSPTIAFDIDPGAVELNYLECVRRQEEHLLPLVLDLTNPSPGIGWNNRERKPILDRSKPDTVMALALLHHLAIGNNVPLDRLADFFGALGRWLIIEFVPREVPQVQRLLSLRKDIFENYTQEAFLSAFSSHFHVRRSEPIRKTARSLHLLEAR